MDFTSIKTRFHILVLSIALMASVSCTENKTPLSQLSVDTVSLDVVSSDSAYIKIPKKAIEEETKYILTAILKILPKISYTKKTKIVFFKKQDKRISIHNFIKLKTPVSQIPQDLIIQDFPIIKEDQDFYTIDWKEGSKSISVESDSSPENKFFYTVFKKGSSYITAEKSDNLISISENTQVEYVSKEIDEKNSVSISYFIEPYELNKNFKPYEFLTHQTPSYFFLTDIIKNDKNLQPIQYATKIDTQKELVFYISSNTPKKFRETIKMAVSYWSHPPLKIQVKEAPKNIKAPHFKYNMIQWVDHIDREGNLEGLSGIALKTVNPHTGEVLGGDIIVYDTTKSPRNDKLNLYFPQSIKNIQEEFAKASIAFIVAHEIGHILGFQHNFAGSLSSSSVMDYLRLDDKFYWYNQIKSGKLASYDKWLVDTLYNGKKEDLGEDVYFCAHEDEETDKYIDCKARDKGDDLLDMNFSQVLGKSFKENFEDNKDTDFWIFNTTGVKSLPLRIFSKFYYNKKLKKKSSFLTKKMEYRDLQLFKELFISMEKNSERVSISSKYKFLDDTNKEEIKRKNYIKLDSEFNDLKYKYKNRNSYSLHKHKNPFDLLFETIFPRKISLKNFYQDEMKEILNSEEGAFFEPSEKKEILKKSSVLFENYQELFYKSTLIFVNEVLADQGKHYKDSPWHRDFVTAVGNTLKEILFRKESPEQDSSSLFTSQKSSSTSELVLNAEETIYIPELYYNNISTEIRDTAFDILLNMTGTEEGKKMSCEMQKTLFENFIEISKLVDADDTFHPSRGLKTYYKKEALRINVLIKTDLCEQIFLSTKKYILEKLSESSFF